MNFNYHIHKSDILCPYCDKEYDDCEYEVSKNLDDRIERECEHCGKNFYAESSIVFSTYAACELNNKEHELVETHIKGFFGCKNCDHHEHKHG